MMTVKEVADRLVELCRKGEFTEAVQELYAEDITSNEPKGSRAEQTQGLEKVLAKTVEFGEQLIKVHSIEVSDPIVAEQFFSVGMYMNLDMKGAPANMQMDEICVYHVIDGKISNEHFFHTVPPAE